PLANFPVLCRSLCHRTETLRTPGPRSPSQRTLTGLCEPASVKRTQQKQPGSSGTQPLQTEFAMKIYEMRSAPNPRRVRMFLAEKGIPMEYVEVNLAKGEHMTPEFA